MEKGIYPANMLFEYLYMTIKSEGKEISPTEVHIILYLATYLYLKDTDEYLIEEYFRAHTSGPKIYELHKRLRGLPSLSPIKEDDQGFYGVALEYSKEYLEENIDSKAKHAMKKAFRTMEGLSVDSKVDFTLNTYPWRKTYKKGEILAIPKKFFKEDLVKRIILRKDVQNSMTKEELYRAEEFKKEVVRKYKNSTLKWAKNKYPKAELEAKLLNEASNGFTHMYIGPIPDRIDIDIVTNYIQTVFPLFTVENRTRSFPSGVDSDRYIRVTFIEDLCTQ